MKRGDPRRKLAKALHSWGPSQEAQRAMKQNCHRHMSLSPLAFGNGSRFFLDGGEWSLSMAF